MVREITLKDGIRQDDAEPEQSEGSGNPLQRKPVKADFEPNILDDYDSYSYHFRLFMMGEDAIASGNFGPGSREQRVVIAETGVTTVEIDEVSIISTGSISKEAGIGAATNFSLQLRQAFGATLLDEIFSAANFLGIKNFRTVPMFLELSFRAQEPDRTAYDAVSGVIQDGFTTESLLGDNDKLRDVVWVWPIMFTNMAINVDSGGSVYTLDACIYGDMAYTNQAADLEKQTVVKANTVYEFFAGLEDELNKKEEQKDANRETVFDRYEFFIDSEFAQSKIVPELAEDIANRAAEFNVELSEKNEFTFNPGVSIDRIVENILSTTEHFQTKAKGTSQADVDGEDKQQEAAAIQTLYRLITDTKIIGFDKNKGDYAREYRYMLIPYEMTTIQHRSNVEANLTNQQRYDIVQRAKRLRKSYNYIYTGLNDQVLDFDFTFNFNWYAALPFQGGLTTPANKSEPNASAAQINDEGVAKPQESEADPTGTDKYGLGDFIDDANQFIQSDIGGSVIAGIATGNFDQLTGQVGDLVASEISKGIRVAGKDIFPDFVKDQFREVDPQLDDLSGDEDAGNPFKNIFFVEDRPGVDQAISGGYSNSTGKTLLTTMFEQAKSPMSADLLDITLQIKGDPYWLEPAPIGRNSNLRTIFDTQLGKYTVQVDNDSGEAQEDQGSSEEETDVTSNNTAASQTYILFRSFTPQNFDNESGLFPKFTENNVLNGVYAIKRVTHTFSGGTFTQSLEAIRDPQISLKDVNLGVGVADTRSLLQQFNIENIIDNPATVFDELSSLENQDWWTQAGGTKGSA